jgi:hypothetical protein
MKVNALADMFKPVDIPSFEEGSLRPSTNVVLP